MRNETPRRSARLLLACALLAAACGPAPTTAPVSSAATAPASAAPTLAPTSAVTLAPSPAATAIDACGLITSADAAVVLGGPATQQRPILNRPGSRCDYFIPAPPINRFLTVIACPCGRTDAQFDVYAMDRARISNVGLTSVGIGDRAFMLRLGLGLLFRSRGIDIDLSLQNPPDFMSPTAPSQRLADAVVEQKAAVLYPNLAQIVIGHLAARP